MPGDIAQGFPGAVREFPSHRRRQGDWRERQSDAQRGSIRRDLPQTIAKGRGVQETGPGSRGQLAQDVEIVGAWVERIGDGLAKAPDAIIVNVERIVLCSWRYCSFSSARRAASARISCSAFRSLVMTASALRPPRRTRVIRAAVTTACTTRNDAPAGCGTVRV
ncbi:MAG: hypothetical protein ACLPUO_12105 [Streptosporangiaceae bacterium]